jgi:hypothetical protein
MHKNVVGFVHVCYQDQCEDQIYLTCNVDLVIYAPY